MRVSKHSALSWVFRSTHLHWFMCKSQLREKLNILSFAKAFCLSVSACVTVCTWGFKLTIEPGPVREPSLLFECPLAPESRLRWRVSHQRVFSHSSFTHPSLLARLFLLRRPTCGCAWTCCFGPCSQGSVCTLRNFFTFSITTICQWLSGSFRKIILTHDNKHSSSSLKFSSLRLREDNNWQDFNFKSKETTIRTFLLNGFGKLFFWPWHLAILQLSCR